MSDSPLKRSVADIAALCLRHLGRSITGYLSRHVLGAAGMLMLSMLTLFAAVLYRERVDALAHARETSGNLATIVERDLSRNLEFYSLSLQAMADGYRQPAVMSMPVQLRDQVLFDRVTLARHISSAYLIDVDGNVAVDLKGRTLNVNVKDRDYFLAHSTLADTGLFLSKPLVSRLSGELNVAISRRVSGDNGEFLGVAVVAISTNYFRDLLDGLTLGTGAVTAIVRNDGTLLMRQPKKEGLTATIGSNADFRLIQHASSGSFIGTSTVDNMRRLYVFKRVDDYPLAVVIAPAVQDILHNWTIRALLLGAMMLTFATGFLLLSRRLANELEGRWRAEQELKKLAGTDALTGLSNRRTLDTVLNRVWARASRTRQPIALLFLDVDHFKAYNDRYGHQQGDAALVQVAQVLGDCLHHSTGQAARYGGEEFVLVLPDTDLAGAWAVATEVFAAIAALNVPHQDGIGGSLTLSIGIATSLQPGVSSPAELLDAADQALYMAKAGGRSRAEIFVPVQA
ncbi:GGDEF domain-containing protein [Pigmentiphaga aceris]|uniref:diguanylate cyclase n=1 Tax=Pigmentiphaga aceris TaxID=1940612 RepID=A0A5C0AZT5_9BURK|nr:sensor domain-containing diguanylate cyclase [Pigmentiphaga aceris]QEI07124.1 GGDEF domain-containing protein [Pigmentiphaga aceris]